MVRAYSRALGKYMYHTPCIQRFSRNKRFVSLCCIYTECVRLAWVSGGAVVYLSIPPVTRVTSILTSPGAAESLHDHTAPSGQAGIYR